MDGTLTVPNLDFSAMYSRCGVSLSEDLLAAIAVMPEEKRVAANAVIDEMEEEGRRTLQLASGVREMAKWLESHNVPCAMVTRNTDATVDALFANLWEPLGLRRFPITISRDSPLNLPAKPDPAALFHIAEQWGLASPNEELLMVGDSPSNDVGFGKAAGAATALVDSGRRFLEEGETCNDNGGGADICVESLALLPRQLWLRYHIDGPLGTGSPLLKYDVPRPSTPACVAAAEGNAAALAALPPKDLARADATGNTPLVWAAEGGHLACVEALLAAGVPADAPGYLGATAVSRAARRGHVEVLRALLAAGADPDAPNVKLQYPLHFAAFKQQREAVGALLEGGANPLVLDRKGRSPAQDTADAGIREVLWAAK
ncbi:unnamed protein product, partial [Heterosigma akashiwo]